MINESSYDLDSKPEMREAFDAVIDAGFIKEYMINIEQSYKIDLVDWTAGIVYKRGNKDSVIVYSFTDHRILITADENDGIRFDDFGYEKVNNSLKPDTFFVDTWNNNNIVFCPVNRNGILFGGKRWFRGIDRLKRQGDDAYFIGKDIFNACVVFDLKGNIIFEEQVSDYLKLKGGLLVNHLAKKYSTLYDNNFNVLIDDVTGSRWIEYLYLESAKKWNHKRLQVFMVDTKKGSFIFKDDESFDQIVNGIKEIRTYNTKNPNGVTYKIYCIRKDNKWNILGRDYELVGGDKWFDSVDDSGDEFCVSKVKMNGKENLVSKDMLELVSDKWYDEIVSTRNGMSVGYYTLGAFIDRSGCNLIDVDVRDRRNYKKVILEQPVDDIKTYDKFIFLFNDGKQYVLWRDGNLISADHRSMFEVQPLTYVLETEDGKVDIANTTIDMSFCEAFMNGKKLDYCSITNDDILGIIEYNGKFSYINLTYCSPAVCDEDGNIKWFDEVEPAEMESSMRRAKCVVVENGKKTLYYLPV